MSPAAACLFLIGGSGLNAMEAEMQMLPPQVELDGIYLFLVLATLAMTWLVCATFPAHIRKDRTLRAASQSRAPGARPRIID
jgi:hypothetical protein